MRYTLLLAVLVFLVACTPEAPADMVVYGKIWTGNPLHGYAEAMAIQGDTIIAVGSRNEMVNYEGEHTEIISAPDGGLIVPGFIDTHTHFVDGGFRLSSVQLRDAKTPQEFINRIRSYAATQPDGTWITGGDWDHENWGGELPTRDWIDSVTQNHPVWINRLDGHMALANSAALRAAGINEKVKDVPGGTIVRKRGTLTGVFKDNAQAYIDRAVPAPSSAQEDAALDAAMNYVASLGVTSVHNMSGYWDVLKRARQQNRLITRIYAGQSIERWKEVADEIRTNGKGDDWLRFGAVKAFVDGSLGSHTAAFMEPFSDAPTDSGFLVTEKDKLYQLIKSADSAGLHPMVHAIGDRAIRTLLNIFAQVEKENGSSHRRFRIEHAQHIHPADIGRFASQKIIASMQPYHAIDDGRWAEKLIGKERIKTTYAFKSLMDAGAMVAFGSDWFVAPPAPLEGIYAAVTRKTLDGKNPEGWVPHQKITVEQALVAYTSNGAFASYEENRKGSLMQGKLADFVVLEEDITTIDPARINEVSVLRTVVGGRTVFEKK